MDKIIKSAEIRFSPFAKGLARFVLVFMACAIILAGMLYLHWG